MERRSEFPRGVREVENLWIPLSDGCRLAARAWLPEGAEREPVPAVLEYIPYRKRDGTRWRDEPIHRWLAGHGYASLRVDLRGSGDSDGLLLDEYLPQEQRDGVETIRWIAAQPWCSGRVAMIGKSWGGFNALQVAALAPPELFAVVAACCADDRYADDAHYMGGCLLNENLVWGSVLFTLGALPPDPEVVGARWRDTWLARMEALPLFPALWLRHQRRDAYWQQGSVGEALERVRCPVLAVGGWADGYSNAVPRLVAGLRGRCAGLVGPWSHQYPHEGVPGPAIGFLQEVTRFLAAALRGEAPARDEPPYRVWLQESAPPSPSVLVRPGRWVAEDAWPPRDRAPLALRLAGRRLLLPGEEPGPVAAHERALAWTSLETTGLDGGSWCGFGAEGEFPGDQRADDGRSLVFDSAPLPERLEILGAPVLELLLAVDRPRAFVVFRLNELQESGASARVSYCVLNLTHRDGHADPRPVRPGERLRVRLRANDAAHAFPAGSRLRVALSTCYWPMVWPSPERVALTVIPEESRLLLPVRAGRPEDARLRPFEPPAAARGPSVSELTRGVPRRAVEQDLVSRETVLTARTAADAAGAPALEHLHDIDLVVGHAVEERFRIHPTDPLSARAEIRQRASLRRGGWSVEVETELSMTADRERFRVEARLVAREGGAVAAERAFGESIPRDGV